ncbi:hypothetical protein G3569_04320 [Aliifodinibius halophilus]|uniref:Uncharacterized protein n=2 Tax=Fodinibius halophilus TaxID=1736908 RepID=A0A6M1T0T6_9BACT|nr:hypothetical protein [Fodinibius halophilus]
MKQRLREQKKKNHEEFRQQMVRDVSKLLQEWAKRQNSLRKEQSVELSSVLKKIHQSNEEVDEVAQNLRSIKRKTLLEINRYKRGRSWKFYGACLVASLIGGFTAVLICATYWNYIRYYLG